MADPATAPPDELRPEIGPEAEPERALQLLKRPAFRMVYAAVVASEVGDAFQYVGLMWLALVTAGPLGVIAVRLADSVPALLFGFHGGVLADRLERRRLMIAADLLRAAVLVPVSIAALSGHLPIWALVIAAFLLTTGASYFDPAYGALLPSLVDRRNVQQANGLVRSTADAATVAGWAAAGGLLAFVPLGTFFAINAASFVVSAALVTRAPLPIGRVERGHAERPRVRDGFAALKPLPILALAVLLFGVCVTISSGTWIVGVPQLVRKELGHGAGAFSLVAASYALGSVVAGLVWARWRIRRKALLGIAAWTIYLPAYGLFAVAHSLGAAIAAGVLCGMGQGSAWVLVNAAAQEEVPDRVLGRVMGLISLVHRGAHATGLLFVSPLFAVVAARAVFGAAGIALAVIGALGTALALAIDRRRPATVVPS